MALTRGTAVAGNAASASSLTFAVDVGSGDRRGLVVLVRVDDGGSSGATVSGVTFNGVALTLKRSETHTYAGTKKITAETWAITGPASGSHDVVVTLSTSVDEVSAIAVPYTDYGGLGTNSNAQSGNLDTFSLTFTTTAATNEMLGHSAHNTTRTLGSSGATSILSADSDQHHALYEAATGGSDTIDWTISGGAARSAAVAVEVLEDTGGGGGGGTSPWHHYAQQRRAA